MPGWMGLCCKSTTLSPPVGTKSPNDVAVTSGVSAQWRQSLV